MFLHRQALRRGVSRRVVPLAARGSAAGASSDAGQIAVIDDSDGVIGRRNAFDLDQKTLRFVPADAAAASYRFEIAEASYDPAALNTGSRLTLKDDDSRVQELPFAFPFFGVSYTRIYVNSDGNLTFGAGDAASTDRSLGRLTSGAPRIAPLFADLDPSLAQKGVYATSEPGRFVVTWSAVPVYDSSGLGLPQTFQVRLYPGGRIEFAWAGVTSAEAVVGIAPGALQGRSAVVSFTGGAGGPFPAAVAERFSGSDAVDIVTAAQKFYATHEDSYDYLVFFNSEGVPAAPGAVAYEVTARNQRTGYGDDIVDDGREYGSARRLQAVLNMGPLSQYPVDPNALLPARFLSRDTTLSVIGHETGHLFLAFASVKDPNNPNAKPMLGRQLAHWSFLFNSEASLMEGNRIEDHGPDASPRFTTVATAEGYTPLDQYLMGFRGPEEVPASFLVTDSPTVTSGSRAPQTGVSFDGHRRDIAIAELIAAVGRRTPDSTVAQRRFRFAFVLIAPAANAGNPVPADQIAQLESYRGLFEGYYARAASDRAAAEATLKRALRLSLYPAAGVVAGSSATATLTLDAPAAAELTVLLRAASGLVAAPASVTIPAGASQASFTVTGGSPGVDSLTAEPADGSFETAFARIQVAPGAGALTISVASGDGQTAAPGAALANPVVVRVSDINGLPYPGVIVRAALTGGGSVDRAAALTDESGLAQFRWTPGPGPVNELRASLDGGPFVAAAALGQPAISAGAVVNAASFAPGITPGSIATLFGANLVQAALAVNGAPVRVFFANNTQINFYVPEGLPGDSAELVATTALGSSPPVRAPVVAISPGLFAAVARAGSIEIYATGLGPLDAQGRTANPVQAFVAGVETKVGFAGLAPGFVGLYQVNAELPAGAAGPVVIVCGGKTSNSVPIR